MTRPPRTHLTLPPYCSPTPIFSQTTLIHVLQKQNYGWHKLSNNSHPKYNLLQTTGFTLRYQSDRWESVYDKWPRIRRIIRSFRWHQSHCILRWQKWALHPLSCLELPVPMGDVFNCTRNTVKRGWSTPDLLHIASVEVKLVPLK